VIAMGRGAPPKVRTANHHARSAKACVSMAHAQASRANLGSLPSFQFYIELLHELTLGLSKQRAAVDLWLKEVAPSPELRKWFGHDPTKWEQFQKRYWKELEEKEEVVQQLKQKGKQGTVTLVYAARDEEHNGALALKWFLEGHTSATRRGIP
jgi:uncharacterized protein YeaO (DUF488 family)